MKFDKTAELLHKLGWPAVNLELYREALTHASFAYELEKTPNNERLEYLGDAVLELAVSEYLFKTFPHCSEGKLTVMRHHLVNKVSLARLAQEYNLGAYIRLGKGEALGGGSRKPSLLADALEALIGALFLDTGYERAKKEILKLFAPVLDAVKEGSIAMVDYKTVLQETCQSLTGETPVYTIAAESGPPHDKTFEAAVKVAGRELGRGKGRSKKEAEQAAAEAAWNVLGLESGFFS